MRTDIPEHLSSVPLSNIRIRLEQHIRQAEIRACFDILDKLDEQGLFGNKDKKLLFQLEYQYNSLEADITKRTLTVEQIDLFNNRIVAGLLDLAASLEPVPAAQLNPQNGQMPFDLKPKPFKGKLAMSNVRFAKVRCDRSAIVEFFGPRFAQKQELGCSFQHYFLLSSREEKPGCIVERLFYEALSKENKDRVLFNDNPVKIHSLPKLITDDVQARYHLKFTLWNVLPDGQNQAYPRGMRIENFGQLLQAKKVAKKYNYVIVVFGLSGESWSSRTTRLLQWLIKQFCKPLSNHGQNNPTFLFFYLIDAPKSNKNAKKIERSIKRHLISEQGKGDKSRRSSERKAEPKAALKLTDITLLPSPAPITDQHYREWLNNCVIDVGEEKKNAWVQELRVTLDTAAASQNTAASKAAKSISSTAYVYRQIEKTVAELGAR